MESCAAFILTFAAGAAGFFVFRFCRVPSPAMLGSMVATGALNIFGLYPDFSTGLVSFAANLLIGMMITKQIDRSVFRRVAELARPMAFQIAGIFALSLSCGFVLHTMAGGAASWKTALVGSAAGGITEMIIFGLSLQADVATIAFVQLFRLVTALSLIPYLAALFERRRGTPRERIDARRTPLPLFVRREYILISLHAAAGSLIGLRLNIPSGMLLGSMAACGAFALGINKRYRFNGTLRNCAQIGLGLVLGQRLTPDMVRQLGELFVPAMATTAAMMIGCTLLALLLRANTGWDMTTCLLCAAPAGITQITAYADEIGVDAFAASVFHTTRIIAIVSIYPWIVAPLI